MSYQSDFQDYIAQVNRLWIEIQALSANGLPPYQTAEIRRFQRLNNESRNTLVNGQAEMLLAYQMANATEKARMEKALRQLRIGLIRAEAEYRRSLLPKWKY